jgi:assimilatory nitrate reductase catalytic subunit
MSMQDAAAGRHRGALFRDGRLLALYCIERDAARLPSRAWLESLFELDRLDSRQRSDLLLGSPGRAAADAGRTVCACHGVGERAIQQAIAGGAATVEALGACLKAGTQCGSCVPELRKLLAEVGTKTPAAAAVG